jgi:hypothetical protein
MLGIRFHWRMVLAMCLVVAAAGCLLICGGSLWGTRPTAEASAVPTPDFIAAAMRNQALASIEMKYSAVGGTTKGHYIRTSDALSLTKTFTDSSDVERGSYDFAARETRKLQTKSDGSNSGTTQTPWLGSPFATLSLHDPVLFVLFGGTEGPRPLYEWIPSGHVLEDREDVDGHLCWRIDISESVEGMVQYSIWADPDAGFCPRRIMMTGPDANKGPTIVNFQDYKELSPGVWFPMKHVNEYSTMVTPEKITLGPRPLRPTGTFERRTATCVVNEATAGKTFSKDSLLVHFPSGTKLYVNSSKQAVTVP